MSTHRIGFRLNGRKIESEVPARLSLVDFIRDRMDFTGTHVGCEHGVCGACSVLVDGEPVRSCLMLAVQADGAEVLTVEGLLDEGGRLSLLQDSFWETHALQCGYCTPGMIVAAHALLAENADPSDEDIREAIAGNLCRCTGYAQIVEAVRLAAARMRQTAVEHE